MSMKQGLNWNHRWLDLLGHLEFWKLVWNCQRIGPVIGGQWLSARILTYFLRFFFTFFFNYFEKFLKLFQSESLPCKPPLFTFRNSFCISSEEQWNRRSSFALTRVTTIWLPFDYHFDIINLYYGYLHFFGHPNFDSKWTIRFKVFNSFRSHVFKAVSV